jgi:hypothetical protein
LWLKNNLKFQYFKKVVQEWATFFYLIELKKNYFN